MTAHSQVISRLRPRGSPDYRKLLEIDWNFASAKTRGDTHGIHPYPAKFIPQIPRALIAVLHPGDDTAVLDPFCGSGTTLVEAATAGVPAVGIDINPLACLISKVKVTPLAGSVVTASLRAVELAKDADRTPPKIPAIDHWFQPHVQRALAALIAGVNHERDPDVRDALRVAFSSIVVRVSNQESDTRYAAVGKSITEEEVVVFFLRAAEILERALVTTWGGFYAPTAVSVLQRDVLEVRSEEIKPRVSLVVTSPPYPNAYEYWLYHKYRMYWLGLDPLAAKEKEIGARPHFFKKNPHTAEDFGHQMEQVFALLSKTLIPGGHASFQVGTSVIRGQVVDNAALIRRAAEKYGFSLVAELIREIPRGRTAFNLTHSRISKEELVVFRLGNV